LLYADDLALLAESKEPLLEKIRRWKAGLEERGHRENTGKTKIMKCQARNGLKEDSSKFPCGVRYSGVGSDSTECVLCKDWVPKKCSGVKGQLEPNPKFQCFVCIGTCIVANRAVQDKVYFLMMLDS
jgi:hypothetical protein